MHSTKELKEFDRNIAEVDRKILALNGIKTHQTTLEQRPVWCPDHTVLCPECKYKSKCKHNK